MNSAILRVYARNRGLRSISQLHRKQHYSSTASTSKGSSSLPWMLSALIVTAGGTWIALQPRSPPHEEHGEPGETHSVHVGEDGSKGYHRVISLAKPEHGGKSEENHNKASEANEHKIRKGVFSKDEFDNHITVHTSDPGMDFEKIKKEENQEAK